MVLKRGFKLYYLLPLIPLLAIGIFCARYHQNIFRYYLPNSVWNDEIMYYKTVEGISSYGIPQGYFGYNESRSLFGTFGAWSPFIFFFDVIVGSFMWGYSVPIIARVAVATVGFGVYALLVKPDNKSCACILLFVSTFPLYARYLTSQMSDVYITMLLIVFMGLVHKSREDDRRVHRVVALVIAVMLILMRPYFAVLCLLLINAKNKKRENFAYAGISALSLGLYFFITHFFSAAYFFPLIKTEWIEVFKQGLYIGIKNIFSICFNASKEIIVSFIAALKTGNAVGMQYLLFAIISLICFVLTIVKKCKLSLRICIINVTILLAIIMLYDVEVGSRHLMPFIVAEGVFLVSDGSIAVKIPLIIATIYLCFFKFNDAYYTTYPTYNADLDADLKSMSAQLRKEININRGNYWENTVLWVVADSDGEYPWQTLYSLPVGMGINVCEQGYVTMCFDELRAGYIACTIHGEVANKCKEAGYEKVYESDKLNASVYRNSHCFEVSSTP